MNPAKKDPATGRFITSWGAVSHFHPIEFRCHCGRCQYDQVSVNVVDRLETIRLALSVPITVVSGIRCKTHNQAVGGAPFSRHLPGMDGMGHAADIMSKAFAPPMLFAAYRKAFGAGGGGLYRSWVHVDDRSTRMEWVGDSPAAEFAATIFLKDHPEGVA